MKKILKITFLILILCIKNHALAIDIQEINNSENSQIWLVEDHSLPVIYVNIAYENSGASAVNGNLAGLPYALTKLLYESTTDFDRTELQQKIQNLAIRSNASVNRDHFFVNFSMLSKNFDESIKIMKSILTKPNFKDDHVSRIKQQILSELQQSKQNPKKMANLTWSKNVFPDHPYSADVKGIKAGIKNITTDNLNKFFKNNFANGKIYISIVGDITKKQVMEKIAPIFLYKKQIPNKTNTANINIIAKNHTHIEAENEQVVGVFSLPSISYKHPDFYPLFIANHILGGSGFTSKLMESTRKKQGLVYSINTNLISNQHANYLYGSFGTKKGQEKKVISTIKKELNNLVKGNISEDELRRAKNSMQESYLLRFSSRSNISNHLNIMQLENFGIDYIQKRNEIIKSVTLQDLKRVTKKYFNPEKLFVLTYGQKN